MSRSMNMAAGVSSLNTSPAAMAADSAAHRRVCDACMVSWGGWRSCRRRDDDGQVYRQEGQGQLAQHAVAEGPSAKPCNQGSAGFKEAPSPQELSSSFTSQAARQFPLCIAPAAGHTTPKAITSRFLAAEGLAPAMGRAIVAPKKQVRGGVCCDACSQKVLLLCAEMVCRARFLPAAPPLPSLRLCVIGPQTASSLAARVLCVCCCCGTVLLLCGLCQVAWQCCCCLCATSTLVAAVACVTQLTNDTLPLLLHRRSRLASCKSSTATSWRTFGTHWQQQSTPRPLRTNTATSAWTSSLMGAWQTSRGLIFGMPSPTSSGVYSSPFSSSTPPAPPPTLPPPPQP